MDNSFVLYHVVSLFSQNQRTGQKLASTTKDLYDNSNSIQYNTNSSTNVLPELIVKGFDDEQIWQQLELDNSCCLDKLVAKSAKLLSSKVKCSFSSTSTFIKEPEIVVKKNNKKNRIQKLKQIQDDDLKESGIESDADIDLEDNFQHEEDKLSDDDEDKLSDTGMSDEEEEIDKNDKFFDFTGDSDDDLNFDFGPLGSKGDLNEQIFDKDESEDENGGSSKNKSSSKNKKSVSFKVDIDATGKQSKPKSPLLRKFAASEKLKKRTSVVDDKFFKLADLETFLEQEDRREERRLKRQENVDKGQKSGDDDSEEEEEDVDIFADDGSEDEVIMFTPSLNAELHSNALVSV